MQGDLDWDKMENLVRSYEHSIFAQRAAGMSGGKTDETAVANFAFSQKLGRNVFTIVDLPAGPKALKAKYILKLKSVAEGRKKYKARLRSRVQLKRRNRLFRYICACSSLFSSSAPNTAD